MKNASDMDYARLDAPEVSDFLFHPRPDFGDAAHPGTMDLMVAVEEDVKLHGRLYGRDTTWPTIVFFHGNGEIVSDYDDLGPIYNQREINFLVVDYRGYGKSGGRPTVTAMMRDSHVVFHEVQRRLEEERYTGPLIVMGRSLGSAPALEIAASYPNEMSGLIIESGFAYALPLLRLIGVPVEDLGITESEGMRNIEKMKAVNRPTLVIHAEFDHIIPFTDGQALFNASPADDKAFTKIAGADHNSIFYHGMQEYMDAVEKFCSARCTGM